MKQQRIEMYMNDHLPGSEAIPAFYDIMAYEWRKKWMLAGGFGIVYVCVCVIRYTHSQFAL